MIETIMGMRKTHCNAQGGKQDTIAPGDTESRVDQHSLEIVEADEGGCPIEADVLKAEDDGFRMGYQAKMAKIIKAGARNK